MLANIMPIVENLSREERRILRDYIDGRDLEEATELRPGTMDVDKLIIAIDKIREGMSEAEIDAMVAAMNEEYIEPFDEDEWRE